MIAVPIRSRRSQKGIFIQKLQHAIPSIVVLGNGLTHLSHEPHGVDLWLGVAEVGVSLLVMGSVVRGFRELRKHTAPSQVDQADAHHGADWIDVCLGAMLSVEAYAIYHATAHVPRPTILLATVMFAIGAFHGKIAAFGDSRRQLRISADSISMPGRRPLSPRLTLTWADVASIEVGDRVAVIIATDGRINRIDLTDVMQPTPIREALMAARTFFDDARHAANASIESAAADA